MQQTAYTITLADSTVITSGETQETLPLPDFAAGTQVLGDETAGYTALTVTTQTQQQLGTRQNSQNAGNRQPPSLFSFYTKAIRHRRMAFMFLQPPAAACAPPAARTFADSECPASHEERFLTVILRKRIQYRA